MKSDLLFSIVLTAAAAIAVATTAITLGENSRARVRITTALGSWFLVIVVLAATNTLGAQWAGAPWLGAMVFLPMAILGFATIRSAAARRVLLATPLAWFVGMNVIRVLGVGFLMLHSEGRLSAPFAPVAGWGDIIVGLAAAPVAWLAHTRGRNACLALLLWNTFGLLDFIVAVGLGAVSAPGPLQLISTPPGSALMTTLPWLLIPGFLVPLLASTHLAVFYRLHRMRESCRAIAEHGESALRAADA